MNEAESNSGIAPPEWLAGMNEYFRKNGYFRAEDVQRILGDAAQSFELRATSDLSLMAKNPRPEHY